MNRLLLKNKKHFHSHFKKLLVILLTVLFFLSSNTPLLTAQTLELGLLIGRSNYQGDLASSEWRVITKQTDLVIGGFLRYQLNESLGLKLQFITSELRADDANSSFDYLKQRNLRFFSPISDTSLRLEWAPFVANAKYDQVFIPYISIGGSFFSFNPKAEYMGQTYELQPLRTEGQGLATFPNRQPYQLYSGSVLGGIGMKFLLNEDLTLGFDFSTHYTFTDYLDDVSTTYAQYRELAFNVSLLAANISYQVDDFFGLEQTSPLSNTPRGNPNLNDFFFIIGISLSYNLINRERSSGKGIGCPTF